MILYYHKSNYLLSKGDQRGALVRLISSSSAFSFRFPLLPSFSLHPVRSLCFSSRSMSISSYLNAVRYLPQFLTNAYTLHHPATLTRYLRPPLSLTHPKKKVKERKDENETRNMMNIRNHYVYLEIAISLSTVIFMVSTTA